MRRRISIGMLVALAATVALAQQPPSPGQGRPRPGQGQEPEWPAPSIREYKPRSTLVVPQHPTPRAKFPAIDIHSHHFNPPTPEQFDRVVAAMDANNLRVLVNLSGGSGERLARWLEVLRTTKHKDRMVVFANVDFGGGVGPGFGRNAAAQLEADIRAGALGLKIYKDLGLRLKRTDGTRLKVDDPELDPIWETCARLGVPVLIHTAEPQEFFEPIDFTNERWLELALFRNRRYQDPWFPRFEELIAERDRMFARHPKTTFIAAHMAYHANDLGRLGRLLDKLPNLFTEVAAVLAEFGRQPRTAHDFFVKYQDRVLFGKDSFQPDEYPYYWRTFETADEYFDYYRDYHAFWKLYGLDLPDVALRKLYYANALKVVKGLPAKGFAGS
ncbi:MAG TPA: amidohydrolase family protein [Vicinamibacterales bacterium]|nr:amidohydrolase family protein [Vicinamibacterales bacterium]